MFYVRYSFCKLAYPSVFLSCVVFFCDDHLFGGNKSSCRFRGTSGGWRMRRH